MTLEKPDKAKVQTRDRPQSPSGPRFSDAYFLSLACDPDRPARKRLAACDRLVRAGRFEKLEAVLADLASDGEVGPDAARLIKVVERVSGLMRVTNAGNDDTGRGPGVNALDTGPGSGCALIRRHKAATSTVLIFTGWARQVWVSISLFDRFMKRFPANAVYLTEDAGLGYLDGIEGLGDNYADTVAGLRTLVDDLGAQKLHCMGTSSGGDAAMRYGLDLDASQVLAFSPYIGLTRTNLINEMLPEMAVGIAEVYRRAESTPDVTVVFGADSEPDRLATNDFAGLPGIRLRPVAGYGRHDVIPELIATGQLEPLLADVLG